MSKFTKEQRMWTLRRIEDLIHKYNVDNPDYDMMVADISYIVSMVGKRDVEAARLITDVCVAICDCYEKEG